MSAALVLAWFFSVTAPTVMDQPSAPPLITLWFDTAENCRTYREQYKPIVDQLFGKFYTITDCTPGTTDPETLEKGREPG